MFKLLRFVYSIDFLILMFSSVENALIYLFFVFIVIPGLFGLLLAYEPKGLGYFSAFLLLCACILSSILSPVSLVLFWLYGRLYDLWKKRRESKAPGSTTTAPKSPEPPAPVPASAKPTAPSATLTHDASPAYRVCHFMWTQSIIFCERILKKPSLLSETYICTAFFYSITKHMRNQDLADEIYSQFESAAESFISDSENKAVSLHYIQSAYWQFRSTLNASGIDPRTQAGIAELWSITAKWAFPDVPMLENQLSPFMFNVVLVTNRTLEIYKIRPTKEHYYFDIG